MIHFKVESAIVSSMFYCVRYKIIQCMYSFLLAPAYNLQELDPALSEIINCITVEKFTY